MMKNRFVQFWDDEHSLTALLNCLVVYMFVLVPASRFEHVFDLIGTVVFSLLLLAGLRTMTCHRLIQLGSCFFIPCAILVRVARSIFGVTGLLSLDALFSIISISGMVVVVLGQVYREGPVTSHRIRGAVAAYLLLAMLFSTSYALISYLAPGSFQLPSWVSKDGSEHAEAFLYFSMISLTTAGFGDITAIHPVARSLVMLETLIGQLYPAILIARLVSLEIETRRTNKGG